VLLSTDDLLCEFCWRRFSNRVIKNGVVVRHRPFFIQSLWSWDKACGEISRDLIYGLKGMADPHSWHKFAAMTATLGLSVPRNACLIPIPSKRNPSGDHAFGFARALQNLTGLAIEACLHSPPQPHQRGLNKAQRRQIDIRKVKRLSRSYACYILVDDVITSGATISAAHQALGRPASIQALCLMDRPLVAKDD
jgi:predicted amidophosphoribosyltransferase